MADCYFQKNGGAWISTKRQEMQREIRERVQVPQAYKRWSSHEIRRQNLSILRSVGGVGERAAAAALHSSAAAPPAPLHDANAGEGRHLLSTITNAVVAYSSIN